MIPKIPNSERPVLKPPLLLNFKLKWQYECSLELGALNLEGQLILRYFGTVNTISNTFLEFWTIVDNSRL